MATKREILELIAERSKKQTSTSFMDISSNFDIHPLTACDHLKRLWRERLIRVRESRPRGKRYRLQTGERISDLRFRLARRGKERLEFYAKQDVEEEGFNWF